ncbi:UNVERIFIED_CONTAM: hypothetical protein GTU68_001097 [Idotea baltica]|nr:hypothetical protein [Idotea baltica]
MTSYKSNHKAIESKWQKFWSDNECFKTTEDSSKKKYYVLEMFPYPSGNLHMGHLRNYSIGDVVSRYKRALGYNILHPMGWDAFGLPAENAAIENKVHPQKWTRQNIENMKAQFHPIGLSYDWDREISTCESNYYKHEQAMFIDFYNNDLAYQKESVVNWDPVDNTVLANEQVVDGKGWRSGADVEKKKLKQWFLKITDFAEDLLGEVKKLHGWPEKVRMMQENWIGKSYGAKVKFKIKGTDEFIEVFTTRPDTLFGASFVGLAPNHPLAEEMNESAIREFVKSCNKEGLTEEQIETAEKRGVKTNLVVEHPFDSSIELPVYLANFILMDYGTGAIFACPAHDERDHDFAKKYDLPIIQVVEPEGGLKADINQAAHTDDADGTMINSDFLNGLSPQEAIQTAIAKLEENSAGHGIDQYRLRDWGISRQRYWGCLP